MPRSLPASETRRRISASDLPCSASGDLPAPDGIIGHTRALDSLQLGLSIRSDGYHVFAMGDPQTGLRSMVMTTVKRAAADHPAAPDTVLLHSFGNERAPIAVRVPSGAGPRLAKAVADALERAGIAVPAAFQADAYKAAMQAIVGREQARSDALFRHFQQQAAKLGVWIDRKEDTLILAPMRDGKPLDAEAFEALPADEQQPLQQAMEQVQQHMTTLATQERSRMEDVAAAQATLQRRTAASGTRPIFDALRDGWSQPQLRAWFSAAESALVQEGPDVFEDGDLTPWTVNVLVTNAPEAHAPVVYEDDPAWPALAGQVEHQPINGALATNHSLVRPGALHRAHGGFLVLEARRLVSHAGAWIGLKRALRQRLIRTEAPMPEAGVAAAVTLEPQPMPLDVDVVLVGTPMEYRALTANDPDFAMLFGIAAEFEPDLPWTPDNVTLLAQRLVDLGRRDGLARMDAQAIARLVEHAGRIRSSQKHLSLAVEPLRRIHREADYLTRASGDDTVHATHIDQAISAQRHREGGAAERSLRGYLDGSVRVKTTGSSVGEVNGLAVLSTGRMRFGMASRISARVWPGTGNILNIERESGLSGSFHDKGILVLTGLLGGCYAEDMPLRLTASLVFEQSYTPVDGDSASMAETVALLSALSGVPVLQGRAITGSVDQNGGAQSIGGVNDKIEGFFDLCMSRGLTGDQGVVIPASNVDDLMLRTDVVAAIEAGQFHVWEMSDVDDAVEVMTGVDPGRKGADGRFPEGSLNAGVTQRLKRFAETVSSYRSS